MTEELQAAIERVKRIRTGEQLTAVYTFESIALSGQAASGLAEVWHADDLEILAYAYLDSLEGIQLVSGMTPVNCPTADGSAPAAGGGGRGALN